jgi:hypothetical protein
MSSYYDDEDELDIRVRRGRVSPPPVLYPEHRHRPVARPVYYQHGSSYLVPEVSGGLHRSRSTDHRVSPPPQPVIINNRIYNDNYEDEVIEDDRYLALAPSVRSRPRSRSRPSSFVSSREDYELERTRKELEQYKLASEREQEEKRIKKEMELNRLREDKRAEEEKRRMRREAEEAVEIFKIKEAEKAAKEREEKIRMKKEAEEAVEIFKIKEAEKAAKEKEEKEEREKEYQRRLEEDLRKSGMDERQIAVVTQKNKAVDPNRPTYTRMSRKHLSIETLNRYRIDYEWDTVSAELNEYPKRANKVQDPDYILIKRWVPEYEQDFLWAHTREIRERRAPVLVAIEGKKKHHEHHETEFEFVRKKKHERKPSPSPLLTFLAGGKR